MTPVQLTTAALVFAGLLGFGLYLLILEIWRGKKYGEEGFITNSMRALMKKWPWIALPIVGFFCFMAGHCFGQ